MAHRTSPIERPEGANPSVRAVQLKPHKPEGVEGVEAQRPLVDLLAPTIEARGIPWESGRKEVGPDTGPWNPAGPDTAGPPVSGWAAGS